MKDRKALIVEDNLNWYKFFEEVVIKSPLNVFQFIHAPTLAEGIEIAQTEEIEIIILDLMLPDSSGLATVARMTEVTRFIPIVVLTTTDSAIMSEAAMHYGIEDYLVKDQYDEKLFFHVVTQAIMRTSIKLKKEMAGLTRTLDRIREMQTSIEGKMGEALVIQDNLLKKV